MKYAIANQDMVVYTVRDTDDGFNPDRTVGELCIPVTDEQARLVCPHHQWTPGDGFRPRPMDDRLRAEMLAAADEIEAAARGVVDAQAREAALDALVSGRDIAEVRAAHGLSRAAVALSAEHGRRRDAVRAARHYYELPKEIRYDGGRPAVEHVAHEECNMDARIRVQESGAVMVMTPHRVRR